VGYYKYLMAKHSIGIYENALMVVNQNLKVNQSLLSNGKGLPAYVSRAESEVKQVESNLLAARNEEQNAKAYFNFLLNKPLADPIIAIEISLTENVEAVAANLNDNINGREELKSLGIAKNINKDIQKLNRSFRTPKVNAFLDLASQGFDFKVNRNSFFYLGGIQMQVPLFAGKRNIYRIEQSELDGKNLELKNDYLRQQLELSASVSRNNAATIYANYNSAIKQEEAARKYFNLIDRGYREGVNTYIEFLDARNQLTSTQLQLNINKYKVLAALADYERQTASYSFK
jgi:outer membrane protein TolC